MAESMQGLKRTHRCAELSAANVGETVTIMGSEEELIEIIKGLE